MPTASSLSQRLFMAAALFVTACSSTTALCAQCVPAQPNWLPGAAVAGTDQPVQAMLEWDPDGAGPSTPRIVLGGYFTAAGDLAVDGLVAYDPVAGTFALVDAAAGSNRLIGSVNALAQLPNGNLVAAGAFQLGSASHSIAIWNGSTWTSLGGGGTASIVTLAVRSNGNIIAGGSQLQLGAVTASMVAEWNGTGWSDLGQGLTGTGTVVALLILPNGELVAGGGGFPGNIAVRNGTSWSGLGAGTDGPVRSILRLANGDLLAGGEFVNAGGVQCNNIARWNGTSWSALAGGVTGATPLFGSTFVRDLRLLANGSVLVGGAFTSAGTTLARSVATWNGAVWSPIASGLEGIVLSTLESSDGSLWFGGQITRSLSAQPATPLVMVENVIRRRNGTWSALANGTAGVVHDITSRPDGRVFVTGDLRSLAGVQVNHIASFDGSNWSTLGSGLDGPGRAMAVRANGDLVVVGGFTFAGGVQCNGIARWDGVQWHALGSGTVDEIWDVVVLRNGDLVVGGNFAVIGGVNANGVARWDGTGWSAFGTGINNGVFGTVSTVLERANGELFVGGNFWTPGFLPQSVARWSGSSWTLLPNPISVVHDLVELRGGELIACGIPNSGGDVLLWTGSSWWQIATTQLSSGPSLSLLPLGDGGFLVGGHFDGAFGPSGLRRGYSSISDFLYQSPAGIEVLHQTADGRLWCGGYFSRVGNAVCRSLAVLDIPCGPQAQLLQSGCTSAAGPVALAATQLPWLGGQFRGRTTGVPANAVAVSVFGFAAQNLPLGTLLPTGGTGCSLLVEPTLVTVVLPSAGVVDTALPILYHTALSGMQMRHQVLPLELLQGGALGPLTASNSLLLTFGYF